MEITISEQKVFIIPEVITPEQARERAWDKKAGVFSSGLSSLLSRPKGEDIKIVYSEKRYEPFWLIECQSSYTYDRLRKFPVQVTGPEVQSVTVSNLSFTPSDDKKLGRVFFIPGVEHCQEEHSRLSYFDGLSGERRDFTYALKFRAEEIKELESYPFQGMAVPPEIRASFVVRQMLQELMRPLQADFDGLTGEMKTGGRTFKQAVSEVLKKDMLFDLGADVLGLIVPGGSIAVKLAKTALEISQTEKKKNSRS